VCQTDLGGGGCCGTEESPEPELVGLGVGASALAA
jgi:hypothetical protein